MKRYLTLMLLSVSLIAVTLVLYSAEMRSPGMGGPGHPRGGHFGGPDMIGGAGFFKLADELEITNPQLLQLRMLFQKHEKIMKAGQQRHMMFKKLSDPDLKDEDVKKMAAAEGKAVEEAIIARFQMMQDLRKILTPEQFKTLNERRHHGIGPSQKPVSEPEE